ncbi:MAG TPA: transglycosylase SLT domain-containing protein [Candidatus Udaeobacter sp.]|nr:transglycosylase SLT domain-containing protein [Candidatus Udaeobacter sp.]
MAGDTTVAESCGSALSRRPSPWRWEATRALEDRALARGDTTSMASFLSQRQRFRSQSEDVECQLYRARMQLARRDSAGALGTCVSLLIRNPTAAPREAVSLFDQLSSFSRDSAEAAVRQTAAAEVEFNQGSRDAAIRRLRVVFRPTARPAGRGNPFLDAGWHLGGMLQRSRRYDEALAVFDTLRKFSPDTMAHAMAALSSARALRDAGRVDSAFAEYRRAAALFPAASWWETGREAEERGQFATARDAYTSLLAAGDGRGRLRLGLLELASGRRDAARAWFAGDTSEAGRFWRAISLRDSARASADSILRVLAALPGYTFYRTCARETLGVRAGPITLPRGSETVERDRALLFVRELVEAGLSSDAAQLLERWAGSDPEAGAPEGPGPAMPTLARLHAIEWANACGRFRMALQMALRARDVGSAMAASPDSAATAPVDFVPYAYPPHYADLIGALSRDRRVGIERELLQAVVWQESRFDSGAVSRVGATGLTQLTPNAITSVAARLHERAPSLEALTDARLNLRYGAWHLKQLLDHFHGRVPLALAAYNAGVPAAERWMKLAPVGGDALLCEMMAYTETRDYVKSILAARQAYRDLKPYVLAP